MPLISKLLIGIAIIATASLGYMGLHYAGTQQFGAFNPTGSGTYLLQSSISSSQNTITLTSFTEPGSNIPYTMTYLNSDIEYGTISPSSGNSEFISFTGITQNASQSATLTGVTRGLARTPGNTGCVASTTLAHAYPGQTQLILSNSPCFYSEYAVKRNTQTISGRWTFDVYPEASSTIGTATTSRQFLTLGQAQSIATQGAATSTESIAGIVRLGTALQAASSTYLGVDIPLVLQTKYATDTPQNCTTSSPCVPVTAPNGFLRSTFIDKTATYLWTALHTFSAGFLSTASSTFSATTSIAASNVNGNALVLNNLAYKFPSTRGASSTALCENGSGSLIWCASLTVLRASGAENSSTGSGSTTTVKSYTIPANTITTGTLLRMTNLFTGSGGGGCNIGINYGNGSATTTIAFGRAAAGDTGRVSTSELLLMATTTSAQYGTVFTAQGSNLGTLFQPTASFFQGFNTGYNGAAATYLSVDLAVTGGTPTCTLQGTTIEVLSS